MVSNRTLELLKEAIQLSGKALELPTGGPFGAVVVRQGEVIGRGWNQVTTLNDPTAHAEIVAIRDACSNLQTYSLSGCEIFSSCEPCPLCLAAIYWARIDRICFAATCDDAAAAGFDDRKFYEELSKPVQERLVPQEQALRDEAVKVLQAWSLKQDRVPY